MKVLVLSKAPSQLFHGLIEVSTAMNIQLSKVLEHLRRAKPYVEALGFPALAFRCAFAGWSLLLLFV